jgi:hypothetical protein
MIIELKSGKILYSKSICECGVEDQLAFAQLLANIGKVSSIHFKDANEEQIHFIPSIASIDVLTISVEENEAIERAQLEAARILDKN